MSSRPTPRRKRLSLHALVLVVLLPGCAYREAMQRGHEAREQQDWAAATGAYAQAVEVDPEDPRARAALEEARHAWHQQSLSAVDRALAQGDLAAARRAADEAGQAVPADPRTEDAQRRVAQAEAARRAGQLRGNAEKASQAGDLREALRLATAALAEQQSPEGERLQGDLHQRLKARAASEEAAGRRRAALADHEALQAFDSTWGQEVTAFRQRWAAQARQEAARGDAGTAYLLTAQAAALERSAPDATQREQLRAEILNQYAVFVEIDGLEGAQHLASRPPADPRAPRLRVQVEAEPPRCTQSDQNRAAEGRYVAGTRQVPNPEWQRTRDEAWRLREELRRAEEDEARARQQLYQAEERLERSRQEVRERRRHESERAERELAQARERERRTFEAWQRARDDAERRRTEGDLEQARRAVEQAFAQLDRIQESHRYPKDDERDRAREQLTHAEEERTRRRDRLYEAERQHERVVPTLDEVRHEIHRYAVRHSTRTCQQPAQITLSGADGPPETRAFVGEASTRDQSHAVQLPLGLDEDPLRFPEDDGGLHRRARQQLVEQLGQLLTSRRQRWVDDLARRAQADAAQATTLAVAAVLLDHGRQHHRLRAELTERFELVDPAILEPR